MVTHMPPSLLEVLRKLAPGTELRNGIERIIQHGSGALVVLGGGAAVDAVCSGGFSIRDTSFSEQRLAELAKMDGAIVLDDSAERILRANVHLIPDASIPTRETGTRHRTAERMAIQTGIPVVSVSEGRKIAVVFTAEGRHELESPVTVLPRANQLVQTLDRFRRRLDLAVELLTRQELEDAWEKSEQVERQRQESLQLLARTSKAVESQFKLLKALKPLLQACAELLAEGGFLCLSTYAVGYSPLSLANLLEGLGAGAVEAGELGLPETGEGHGPARVLPCGFCARWCR